jgi:hypothetical protein
MRNSQESVDSWLHSRQSLSTKVNRFFVGDTNLDWQLVLAYATGCLKSGNDIGCSHCKTGLIK